MQKKKKKKSSLWVCKGLNLYFAFFPIKCKEDSKGHHQNKLGPCGLRVASVPRQVIWKVGKVSWVKCSFKKMVCDGMFWKYKLEKWNSLHHPNHGSYFLGLDHLSAPDMLWHPSCKQIVPRALFSCQHPCPCSLEAKCPGEWSSPFAASSPGSSSNLCTQAVSPPLKSGGMWPATSKFRHLHLMRLATPSSLKPSLHLVPGRTCC